MNTPAILLVLLTCAAAAFDLRTRRIPNLLTGAAAIAALAVHLPAGPSAILLSLAAMAAAFVAGMLAFSAGWFGGGDVKLVAVCCGVVGVPGAVSLVLYVLVAGAVLAIVAALVRGRLVALVRSTAMVAVHGAPVEGTQLPYAVAIAGGSVAYVVASIVPVLRMS